MGYISDVSSYKFGIYYDVVDGYKDLRGNHPDVINENDEKAVQINNAAEKTPERVKQAQQDAVAPKQGVLNAVSDSLGPEARKALRESLKEHRLPKTEFLLGHGYFARAGGLASSTFAEKQIFHVQRPVVKMPDRIHKYPMEGTDIYHVKGQPSYPSGHANQASWITACLAMMLPEMGSQILDRGAISGESRVILGVHAPLDVIAGRMSGQAAAADRWNDPHMREALTQAGAELRAELEWRTGKSIEQLAAENPKSAKDSVSH
ncbi:phosphatase PAP2 family protein [Cutibacterium equinum]|uniref:Phosphatase PAP2 family protein n=1 Tax=Cutibacterium equinum TaxID=3016342 RepID=A0ABY7QZG9_9ACTN|nr:phosphatase PAP2 family protein [Cutibacterium equinum]WCC80440.1 phosphatase PAP2 family protein [Cutibacterium equinum]